MTTESDKFKLNVAKRTIIDAIEPHIIFDLTDKEMKSIGLFDDYMNIVIDKDINIVINSYKITLFDALMKIKKQGCIVIHKEDLT